MNNYLSAQEDGLTLRECGEWTILKLDYLQRYIHAFLVAMKNRPWRATHYIDLFSGPGKSRVRETKTVLLGSPLIALSADPPFVRLFLSDLSRECVTALSTRCSSSPDASKVCLRCGDANNVVDEIVGEIRAVDERYIRKSWPSLNLAFLDPEAFELEWRTVEKLASISRMDLIIYYPQMPLNRACRRLYASCGENGVDRFFGDRGWRKIYQSYLEHQTSLHRALIDYYKNKLAGLGYTDVMRLSDIADEPLLRSSSTRSPLYRLIFASKASLGHKLWRAVVRRDAHGQLQMPLR